MHALESATSVIALFVEHLPFGLRPWFTEQLAGDAPQAGAAVALVERELLGAVGHLRAHGMSHFDAHLDNVLTDGHRIYLTDFGLATSTRFQLDEAEREFFDVTRDHDLAHCAAALANTVAATRLDLGGPLGRNEYVRHCAVSGKAAGLHGPLADVVVRYAGVATVVNDFYRQLHGGELTTVYPAAAIARALDGAGVPRP